MQNLDNKINRECEIRQKKEDILDDRRSNASSSRSALRSRSGGKADDELSVRSVRSNASSRRSAASAKPSRAGDDAMSVASSRISRATDIYSEINEEDEWFAI